MTNKNTRRALLASLMALILCVSSLLGTTYAWFTDSVTSSGNKIVAGSLKIDLLLKDKDDNWTSLKDTPKAIFDYENWEPGYTDVKVLKVVNEGTLALKWMAKFISAYELTELADVIDVYVNTSVTDLPSERDLSTWTKVGTVRDFVNTIEETTKGTLNANEYAYLGIALKMQETAGNEYQGMSLGGAFDIQILATQYTAEDDSFDNTYDENAPFGTYIELGEGEDLLAALASAEAGMPLTIKLNGNVEWPTDGHHGENDITPASSIVIDGNGYTITATGSGVTPLGDVEAPMTLKNLKIVDNSVSYNEAAWELSYLEMGGKILKCVNVDFADPISVDGENASFTNCSFVGHYDKNSTTTTQYGVWVANGNSTFTNCTFTGTRGMKICDQYAPEVGTVIIDSCIFDNISEKPGIAIDDEDTQDMKITIKNSTFINCKAGDQGLYVYETDNTVPTVANNTVHNNATVVSTKDEFLALSAKAFTGNNGTTEEATVIIAADIDMEGAEFSAMIAQRGDKLIIVGNGHKISNVKLVSGANDNTTGQASMFYTYPNSTLTVSNLTLENVTVTADAEGTGYAAAVVGYCEGAAILNNVDVVNATVTGVKSSGMLVGHLSGSLTATNCTLSGSVTLADFAEEANGHYAGKYIGTLAGAAQLNGCTANVTVSGNLNTANIGEVYGRKTAAGSSNVEYAKDQTALNAAINGGSSNVILGDGDYVVPSSASGKTLTIVGNGNTVIDITTVPTYAGLPGATITFENVVIKSDPQGAGYNRGFAHTNKVTYNNCVINGTLGLNTDTEFNGCTFNISGNYYNLWTWGALNVTLNNCTINSDGKAVLLYGGTNTKLTVNGCTFNDNGDDTVTGKAAIEIGNDYNKSYELIVNNTVVNGYSINTEGINTGSTLWANKNSMGTDKLNVVIDGVDVY